MSASALPIPNQDVLWNNLDTGFDDSLWTKAIAWAVTLLNILHVVFVFESNHHYLITTARQDNLIEKAQLFWALPASVAAHVVLAGIVFFYYILICYRLLTMKTGSVRIAVMITLIIPIGVHCGIGIATVIKLVQAKNLLRVTAFRQSHTIPMLSTQLAADAIASLTLCLALPRPTHEGTRHATRSIMAYTVSRGIVTAMAALVELLVLCLAPNGLWFVAVEYIIPSLYANSFFSALNSRKKIRRQLMQGSDATPPMSLPLGLIRHQTLGGNTTRDDASTIPRNGVKVEVFTVQKRDDEPYERAVDSF